MPRAPTPSSAAQSPAHRSNHLAAILICAALLLTFALTSFLAARHKSATYDEPVHAVAADFVARHADFRLDPEDPPLWQYWAILAQPKTPLELHYGDAAWDAVFERHESRTPLIRETMYATPGNDPDHFLMRLRLMLIPFGAALGALLALWAYRLAGPIAAITAAALFAFEPTFLAHASAIKNDVAITLVGAALAYATWRAGIALTWPRALAVILIAALAPITKFSGPLQFIILPLLLATRVALPGDWPFFGRALTSRLSRAAAAMALFLCAMLAAYAAIWASYCFRFAPTPDGKTFDTPALVERLAFFEIAERHFRDAPPARRADMSLFQHTPEELAAWKPGPLVRAMSFCDRHRLLPQSWTYGLLFTYRDSRARLAYLNGNFSYIGFWNYFPLAYAYKTPIATQLALFLSAGIAIVRVLHRPRLAAGRRPGLSPIWSITCILLPFLLLSSAILTSNLNIGIRHLLPIYPFLYLAMACTASYAWSHFGRNARAITVAFAAALAVESLTAFPDYLSFFNLAAGGARNGIHLLSDSNLDWGQDLPLLADWQRQHPDKNLYLCYFGTAEPDHYGIKYVSLPGSFDRHANWSEDHINLPRQPGVIAISATSLQGIYYKTIPRIELLYTPLRGQPPTEVLGGTLYLFDYDPR